MEDKRYNCVESAAVLLGSQDCIYCTNVGNAEYDIITCSKYNEERKTLQQRIRIGLEFVRDIGN